MRPLHRSVCSGTQGFCIFSYKNREVERNYTRADLAAAGFLNTLPAARSDPQVSLTLAGGGFLALPQRNDWQG